MGPIQSVWAVFEWREQASDTPDDTIHQFTLQKQLCHRHAPMWWPKNNIISNTPAKWINSSGQGSILAESQHPAHKKVMVSPRLYAKFVSFVWVHRLPPSSEPFWDMGTSGICHGTFCREQFAVFVLPWTFCREYVDVNICREHLPWTFVVNTSK